MGKLITDVGVDLDGVLYPFVEEFGRYCCERMGKLFLPQPTHWHFYEDWDLDQATFDQWIADACNTHEVFATGYPYDGVVEAWEELQSMGLRLHILTARPQAAWAQTAAWLSAHNLKATSLHFNASKGFFAKLVQGKGLLIDDHVTYYDEVEPLGIIPVLMNRPWNMDKQPANRVHSLDELVTFIRNYNDTQKEMAILQVKKTSKSKYPWEPDPYIYPHGRGISTVPKKVDYNQPINPVIKMEYPNSWLTYRPEQNS